MFFAPWIASALAWLLRAVITKFIVLAAVIALVEFLAPKVMALMWSHFGIADLSGAFAGLSPAVWYWLDLFRVDIGLRVMLAALVVRFLIRRMPVIG